MRNKDKNSQFSIFNSQSNPNKPISKRIDVIKVLKIKILKIH